ncbi:uncharacterized protein LOC135484126 [Lineus longissimus]|uniref:uncharacterized protein LOC135484126 n=1 Tax=Lineus longissimus TaxID=88925 RepID=UPI002B4C7EB1
MSLGVEPYPTTVQTIGPLTEMEEHGKPLTPLPEEIEGEEKEEALQRLNEEFKGSKHEQIFRFLRDQEELNRRFAQFAMKSDDEDSPSSDESDGVVTQKMSFYTGRRGRKLSVSARSESFDSLEQNVPSDDDRGNLNELDEEIERSAAEKKERKKQKQKKQLRVKTDVRPQTAMGNRASGDFKTSFFGANYETVDQASPSIYRTESDPVPPAAPRSSPNVEYGEPRFPQSPQASPPQETWDVQQIDLRGSQTTPRSSRATPPGVRYSSYGSTSRRPTSVVPSTEHMDYRTHTPRQTRLTHGVAPSSTLDERTRQRLYAEAEGIMERQNQNNSYRQGTRYASGDNTFITRLDCDESTYRRFSKSAQGVRKSSTLNDLNSYKGNARPIKVLKLPPLDTSVINKNVRGTGGLVGATRGGPGPKVAESLVG